MFLWLTVDYSIKPSHWSNRVLSVSQGHGSDRTAGKEHSVHEVISWVSVWTHNLCVSGLTLYPLRYLRYLMIQQPFAELLLHSRSPVRLSVWWTVMRVHYLFCSRLCMHLHYGMFMQSRVELTNIISVFKLRVCEGYLWGSWLADSQRFSEVSIHSVIGLPFSLRRLNPFNQTQLHKTEIAHAHTHSVFYYKPLHKQSQAGAYTSTEHLEKNLTNAPHTYFISSESHTSKKWIDEPPRLTFCFSL